MVPRFASVTLIVLDSVGCGGAADASAFGDDGADTLGHVVASGEAQLPNLARLGLGALVPALGLAAPPGATFGVLQERGPGKDTMLGHWELMGVVAQSNCPVYPHGFPDDVLAEFARLTGLVPLGNRAASGTAIIDELGAEHMATGRPILYTSGDSVFQLAAHEAVIPQPQLYDACRAARQMLHGEHAVGRVIARPFVGDPITGFRRTPGRRDFPLPPPRPTALDYLHAAGVRVHAIGKIHDIFAGRGLSSWEKTVDNAAGIEATARAMGRGAGELILTNLVDFDSEYGHRNDVYGYARELERFDAELPRLLAVLPADSCMLLTADHGNDPTTPGTDHTRERVPLLIVAAAAQGGNLGVRDFADVGATLLDNFGVAGPLDGTSFLGAL